MFEGVTLGGRYQVYGKIGGSSLVIRYDGVDTLLARPVDIVVLTPQAASDPGLREQFQALGRVAAARSHPHIIDVYDIDVFSGQPFVVTEHMAGESLRSIIETEAPFHPDDVVALIQQLAPAADNGLTRVAGGAMVSAETVLVDASGIARHSDFLTFGARVAAVAEQWPTPPALPVQASGVQAIATIAYQLLTAQSPDGSSSRVLPPSIVNAAVTPDIDRIVLRGLDPRLRDYPSAASFTTALTAAARRARQVREQPTASSPPGASETPTLIMRATPATAPISPGRVSAPDMDAAPDDDPPVAHLVTASESRRRFPWAATAIVVLSLLVVALAVARFYDSRGGNPQNAVSQDASVPPNVAVNTADNQVPVVIGLTRDAAATTLSRRGLILQEGPPMYSEMIAAGAVAAQHPAAGSAIPDNRTVEVELSKGPSSVDLAALSLPGMAEADASQELARRGFVVQAQEVGNASVPAGHVISVEPNGVAKAGSTVTLAVSMGNKVRIPRNIFSMPLKDAESELARAGIQVAGTIGVGQAAIQGRIDTAHYQIVSGDVVGVQNQPGDAAFGAWVTRDAPVTLVYFDASS